MEPRPAPKYYKNCIGLANVEQSCALPFRLESYSACSIDCSYCFPNAQLKHKEKIYTGISKIRPADLDKISSEFTKAFDRDGQSILSRVIKSKMPVHWSTMSDAFQPIEKRKRISLKILDILNNYNYPVVMDTKGKLCIEHPWIDKIMSLKHLVFQTSMVTGDDKLRIALEPNVSNETRINMLKTFHDAGFPTVIRIQPVIPLVTNTDTLIKLIDMTKDVCDHYTIEFMRFASDSGRYMPLSARLGLETNLYEMYQAHPQVKYFNRQFTFNKELKRDIIMPVVEAVHDAGKTVGVKDNNNFMIMNDFESCCAVERYSGFENIYKRNFLQACHLLKKKGRVCHADLMCFDGISDTVDQRFTDAWERNNRLATQEGVYKDDKYYTITKQQTALDEFA